MVIVQYYPRWRRWSSGVGWGGQGQSGPRGAQPEFLGGTCRVFSLTGFIYLSLFSPSLYF